MISLIVAYDENRAMGLKNDLPWHLPDDFAMFKRVTSGHPIIMGRKTFESLGKPLPKRTNIVISSDPNLALPNGVYLASSLQKAIELAEKENPDEIFIIGGAVVFKEALPLADKIYTTLIHTKVPEADTWFPDFRVTEFFLVEEEFHPADERHKNSFTFQQWLRVTDED